MLFSLYSTSDNLSFKFLYIRNSFLCNTNLSKISRDCLFSKHVIIYFYYLKLLLFCGFYDVLYPRITTLMCFQSILFCFSSFVFSFLDNRSILFVLFNFAFRVACFWKIIGLKVKIDRWITIPNHLWISLLEKESLQV